MNDPAIPALHRRRFLRSAGAMALGGFTASVSGIESPFQRSGKGAHLHLGLAAYSFRNHFEFMRGKPRKLGEGIKAVTMLDFISFCAANEAAAELTSYFFPPDVKETDFLPRCRHLAHVSGVPIAGTAVGNNFSHPADAPERAQQMAYVKEWIDHSSVMGAPHIRVFAGKHPKGVSEEDAERNAIEALEEAAEYAGKKGVFLGIENHDSIGTAGRLLRIVKAVKSPWVGVNLDTGNFRSDDPYADMGASAPYTVNVQVKTSLKVGGKVEQTDYAKVVGILRDAGYRGFVVLEYEENADPFENVPRVLDELRAVMG